MLNGNVIHDSPLFLPALWSVYHSIELGISQTQNVIDSAGNGMGQCL